MLQNSVYKCNYCESKLRFRYQVGFFDIPVSIYCPNCNCHIIGKIFIDNEKVSIKEKIIGASFVGSEDYDFVNELSTEFLIDILKDKSPAINPISPFLRSNMLDEEKAYKMHRLFHFSKNSDGTINIIENLYRLLDDERVDLIQKYFLESDDVYLIEQRKKIDFNKIINKLDAMLAIKHYINILIIPIMPEGVFNHLYNILNVETRRLTTNHIAKVMNFLKDMDESFFQTYLHRIPKFIVDYIKCVDQLIPIYNVYQDFDSINFKEKGITTLSVDDMVVIYKKGYELLCDSIDLLIGLYNIELNGAHNDFGDGPTDFAAKLNNYNSKFIKYQSFTSKESTLFDGIKGVLNNVIRNAEGHNSIVINGLEQKISFINKHKGSQNTFDTSFLEFGKMCIDLFVSVLYVWEYYYQFVKLKSVLIDRIPLHYGK